MDQSTFKSKYLLLTIGALGSLFFGLLLMVHFGKEAARMKSLEVHVHKTLSSLHRVNAETRGMLYTEVPFGLLFRRWEQVVVETDGNLQWLVEHAQGAPMSPEVVEELESLYGVWNTVRHTCDSTKDIFSQIISSGLKRSVEDHSIHKLYLSLLNKKGSASEIYILRHLESNLSDIESALNGLSSELTELSYEMEDSAVKLSTRSTRIAVVIVGLLTVLGTVTLLKMNAMNDNLFGEITERKQAIVALKDKEADLNATLNSLAEAVITFKSDGEIIRANPSAVALLCMKGRKLEGESIVDLVEIMDYQSREPIRDLAELCGWSGTQLPGEFYLVNREKSYIRADISMSCINNEQNGEQYYVAVIRDATKVCRLNEQLHQSMKMESIGKLAGGVAHDFNNMLGGILGYGELLRDSTDSGPKQKTYASWIVKTAERAASLTEKLLAFSRKAKLMIVKADVHNIVHDVVNILSHCVDKRITIEVHDNAHSHTVEGDPSQLQNAFLNLGLNSRDAMPDGGTLVFGTENVELSVDDCQDRAFELSPGSYLKITVSDTGEGMPSEIAARVFEPFFTTKPVGQGTGLGLSAVYGTICEHKGAVTIRSEPDAGTVFTILLPVFEQEQGNGESSAPVKGKGSILIVDDEAVIRNTASENLESLGYRTRAAEDGAKALRMYSSNPDSVDAVLLDIIMPELDGVSCLKKMVAVNPDVKVVIASGYDDHRLAGIKASDNLKILKKPYNKKQLSEAFSTLLGED